MNRKSTLTAALLSALILLITACGSDKTPKGGTSGEMDGAVAGNTAGQPAAAAANAAETSEGNAFTDPRDGQTYRTVKIGNHTWMARNLNFKTDDSWCYGNVDSNCAKYGRLYTWDVAMKACPVGWYLPMDEDWHDLVGIAGDDAGKLKSKTGWDGTDAFGFSALPGGFRGRGDIFNGVGSDGNWWGNSNYGADNFWGMGFGAKVSKPFNYSSCDGDGCDEEVNTDGPGKSVRCIKGEQ